MAEDRPTENPKWAESAPASNISEPTTPRTSGYNAGEAFPHQHANWLFRTWGRWFEWLSKGAADPSVRQAILNTKPGDVATVADFDYSINPNNSFDSNDSLGLDDAVFPSLCTDGQWLYAYTMRVSNGTYVAQISRIPTDDIEGNLNTSFFRVGPSVAATNWTSKTRVKCDGDLVICTWGPGNRVRAYKASNKDLVWESASLGSHIVDIALTDTYILAAGESYTTALQRSDGADISFDDALPGTTRSVCAALPSALGESTFFLTKAQGSSYKLYRLRFTGNTLSPGNGWSSSGVSIQGNAYEGRMVSDGDRVFVATMHGIECFSAYDGTALWDAPFSSVTSLTCDDRRVYIVENDQQLVQLCPRSGAILETYNFSHPGGSSAMCTDGARLFIGSSPPSGAIYVRRTGRGAQIWDRANPGDRFRRPFPHLLLPRGE